jgi:hypothetical protein
MLVTLLIVLVVLGLALYAVQLLPLDGRLTLLLQVVLIIIAIVFLLRGSGLS